MASAITSSIIHLRAICNGLHYQRRSLPACSFRKAQRRSFRVVGEQYVEEAKVTSHKKTWRGAAFLRRTFSSSPSVHPSWRSIFEPLVELVKTWNLPDWLVHWGHPGNMAVVLFAMGSYGTYLGFRIRLSKDANQRQQCIAAIDE